MQRSHNSTETWLDIPGYDGRYKVSDVGRVASFTRRPWKIMRPAPSVLGASGWFKLQVSLVNSTGERRTHGVSNLVLLAFVGPPPAGHECCHWDDDPRNNSLVNLRWGTRKENCQDRSRNGRGRKLKFADRLAEMAALRGSGLSFRAIGELIGCDASTIRKTLSRLAASPS